MSNKLTRIINSLIRIYWRHINWIPTLIIMVRIYIYGITNSIIMMKARISRRRGLLRTLRILLLNSQQIFFKSEIARNHRGSGN